VDEDEVVLLPVVALVVVDLVSGALEDVERCLVLVAVAAVAAVAVDLDEVHLQGLGQELLVPGADPPGHARLLGAARVPDGLAVVGDNGLVPDARMGELLLAELLQLVLVRLQTAHEHTTVFTHGVLLRHGTDAAHCGKDYWLDQ
jgi:hypothetical protein